MEEIEGRLYSGNLQAAIEDFANRFGEPKYIYCNKGEFTEAELIRITDQNWPRGNFVLTSERR